MNKHISIRLLLIFLVLLLLSGAVFYVVSVPRGLQIRQTVDGILDIRGKDFNENFFALDGQWEFYHGQLLSPSDFTNGQPEGKSYLSVPKSWHNDGYPLYGFATYRLILLTDEEKLSMFVPDISDSGVVYINGERVFEAGRPGVTIEETVPGLRNQIVPFSSVNGQVEIIIQAANFGWWASGLRYRIEVGSNAVILANMMVKRLILAVFIGVMLAMSLYHIMLFLHRRMERVYLIFALYCIIVAARFFTESNGLAQMILPGGMGTFLKNVLLSTTYLQSLLLALFTHAVFNIPINKRRMVVYTVSVVVAFLFFALPYGTVNVQITYTAIIPLIMSFISAVRRSDIWQKPYNLMYLSILAIMNMWYPVHKIFLEDLFFMPGIATNLFMIVTQCLVLSVSYAEAKRRGEELAEQNKLLDGLSRMKSEYLANMSHEMKTPLTIISGHVQQAAELFEASGMDDQTANNSLKRAQEEIMRVARLSANSLWLASMQESREYMKPLSPSELLIKSAEPYRSVIEKRGNKLIINVPDGLPSVNGNADQLIQVIANLLTNANTHTKDGIIIVSAESNAEGLTVTVADSGAGVSPEVLPRIFERGVTDSGGSGVGLEICKNIIEAHGGTIKTKSEPGEGAAFAFTLPVLSS